MCMHLHLHRLHASGNGNNISDGDGAAFIDGEAAQASHASLEDSEKDGSDDGAGNESKPSSKRPRNCLDDDDDDDFFM